MSHMRGIQYLCFSPKAPKASAAKPKAGSKHEARTSIIQSSANEAIPLTDIRTEDWKEIG